MGFWNKLFGKKNEKASANAPSHIDKYKRELNELNLKSASDLENLLKPLISPMTRMNVLPASALPENTQLESHFGGHPYFEAGESWPTTEKGKPLDFVFQVFNSKELELPETIALVQLFYDWEALPWDTGEDGWLVKIYPKVDQQKIEFISRPEELNQSPFCKIAFMPAQSLPNWEGIEVFKDEAVKLSCVLNEESPWNAYEDAVSNLIGEQDYQSQLGGYPRWVQGDETPLNAEGKPLKLLFQIDSEENANLMWGDMGSIYVFYQEETKSIEFTLQCY
ncbi:DUF1963 domain-containing protein [Leeuwenhoekiella nanhaiensis]|uniref:DUF1963 domain-containing protein n=1 Tax=Leeuwenhoekiella nanhaiensis TaxID=1655491 RepID=A0A2G1VPI4_9FLAO|nr:YwqG family protein [Leeuwenhoekiella nanhaiensis]PHQ28678.1 hypothetical protein CJ305_14310 [Leeuwenhoekiella nanhaiensis]